MAQRDASSIACVRSSGPYRRLDSAKASVKAALLSPRMTSGTQIWLLSVSIRRRRRCSRIASDAEHLRLLRMLTLKSQICVPLVIRGESRAALTVTFAESSRGYGPEDLRHAMKLASCCAMAME